MNAKYPVIDMKKTGSTIKMIMLSRGYKVKDLQQFLGFDAPQGIYHWLEGKALPSVDNLYALSELFCLPVDTFIRGTRKFVFVPFQDIEKGRLYRYYCRLSKCIA